MYIMFYGYPPFWDENDEKIVEKISEMSENQEILF